MKNYGSTTGLLFAAIIAAQLITQDRNDSNQGNSANAISFSGKLVDPEDLLMEISREMKVRTSGSPDEIEVSVVVVLQEKRTIINFLRRKPTEDERKKLDNIFSNLPAIEGGAEGYRKHQAGKAGKWRERYANAKTDSDRIQVLAEHAGLADPK